MSPYVLDERTLIAGERAIRCHEAMRPDGGDAR